MHSRILHRLSGYESGCECAVGTHCLSYTSNKNDSLDNLIIYGKATPFLGPLGTLNSSTGRYETKVRIHGINIMDGFEFFERAQQRYGSYVDCMIDEDSYFVYDYDYAPDYLDILGIDVNCFKENTVYTFRFHFIGRKNSSTGIQIYYTDNSSEDIISGDSDDCYIAYTSAEGKTISRIKFSNISISFYSIDVPSFGIFEGAHGYDYFDIYRGQVYTLSTSSPYCGHTAEGICRYDTFDWKNKISTLRLRKVMLTRNDACNSDHYADPWIVEVSLPYPMNLECPMDAFYNYTKKDSLEDIMGVEYTYTIVDEDTIYISAHYGLANAYEAFYSSKGMVYARDKISYVREKSCISIPSVAAGYVGIEVWGTTTPSKLVAYYKK